MLNIGEFARFAGVSVRMLRHYDELGLLVPTEVDPHSGYRRYGPELLSRAHRLVTFRALGFSLDQIGALLDDASLEDQRLLLERRRSELAEQVADDRSRLVEIERRLRLIEGESTMEFQSTTLPRLRLAQLTAEVSDQSEIAGVIGPLYARVFEAYAGRPTGSQVAWYDGLGDRLRLGAGIAEDGEPPTGLEPAVLPAVEAVVTTFRGPISQIGDAWQALASQVADSGRSPVGPCREIYHEVHPENPAATWVIELQQPVA